MSKIIRIDSARHMDGDAWEVGKEIGYKSGKVVTEIKDMSTRGDDDTVHIQYDIYANGKLYKSLINMPVQVQYELEGDNQ